MKSCLIVEDNNVVRGIIAEILTNLGLVVIEKASAEQAVTYCAEEKPDMVILDWDLPSLGALDFLGGVGALDAAKRPNIILCATENDPQQFKLAKAAGAEHHMLKPFNKAILTAKLAEIGFIGVDSGQDQAIEQDASTDVA